MNRPRGAKPSPRHMLARATPHRPTRVNLIPRSFGTVPDRLSFWMNNIDGCCVTTEEAASAVAYSIWGKVNATPTLWIPDESVYQWASSHGVLNGAIVSDVLEWRQQDAMLGDDSRGYLDGSYQSVDYTSDLALRSGLVAGPIKLCVAGDQLDAVVSDHNGWVLTGAVADKSYDHCIPLWGFGTMSYCCQTVGSTVPDGVDPNSPGYLGFTYGTIGVIDQSSLVAICCEAWLRTPTTVFA